MDGSVFVAGGNKDAQLDGIVQTHVFDPDDQHLEPRAGHGRGALVPERHAAEQRRDADHRGRPGHPGGPHDRTAASALAHRRVAEPAALPVDRRRARRPRLLLRSRPDDAQPRHLRHRRLADLRPARLAEPRLRQPRDVRHRQDPRRRRRPLEHRRPGHRPERADAAGLRDRRRWPSAAASTTSPCSPMAPCSPPAATRPGRQLVDLNNGVYPAELWNPATGQWTTLAAMQVTRQYHSTALLLPDGRVLSAGGGICGTCDPSATWRRTPRSSRRRTCSRTTDPASSRRGPTISSAPATSTYDAAFSISTPDAASIGKVALVRLGAVTHSVNMEQRYVPLSFTAGGGSDQRHRPGQRQHRAAGRLHAVPDRRRRRPLGGEDGECPPAAAAPPTVSSVTPAAGASGVARATKVTRDVRPPDGQGFRRGGVLTEADLQRRRRQRQLQLERQRGRRSPRHRSERGRRATRQPWALVPATRPAPTSPRRRAGIHDRDTAAHLDGAAPDGNTEVLPDASVIAIFDTAMDKPSAEAAFSLKRTSNGASVAGSFGWYGNALIFKPELDPGCRHPIHGNGLDGRPGCRREPDAGNEDLAVHDDEQADRPIGQPRRRRLRRSPGRPRSPRPSTARWTRPWSSRRSR